MTPDLATGDSRAIDHANASFWDELCGTSFAKQLGVTDRSIASLRRFDSGYLERYPYLLRQVPVATMGGKKVLEVGLGYGTLGQKIAEAGAEYTGLDIARGPVEMINHRLRMQGLRGRAIQGSMLQCPLPDASVDVVVSIGCFHHTGNVARCIEETWRMLRPGGEAYIMVYNIFSYRRWIKWPWATLGAAMGSGTMSTASESERRGYDVNGIGAAAPETVFLSRGRLRALMRRFSRVSMALENCGHVALLGHVLVRREQLLGTLGKMAGMDIYVSAVK